MGTQQILLVVLSVIIIGIAVSVGIQIQHVQTVKNQQQIMISRMNDFVVQALAYRKIPPSHGGSADGFLFSGDW